ncbi:MAG: PAS domain S-box protein [Coleofasciculaceae cyanobacterium]
MTTHTAKILNSKRKNKKTVSEDYVSNDELGKFFELTQEMFFIAGFDGFFKQINPMCEKVLGLTRSQLLSQAWIEFVHPEDQALMLKQLQALKACTETVEFEHRFRCQDSSYKWLLWKATPCQEEQLIYAVVCDRTEHKLAEAIHWQTEERFQLLVEGIKDYAIILLDLDGHIASWNTGAQRIKQYQASEIIGQSVACFYTPEDLALGQPYLGLELAASQGRFEDEGWRVRKDGSKFWANVVITVLQDAQGQPQGFVRVTRDITERKLAEKALQKAHQDLEKRVEMRTAELTETNELLKQEIAEREKTEMALRQSRARLKNQAQALEAETQHVKALLEELQRTQAQLLQTEKMSSLGQLVAGVAHEINNPVGFIYGNIDYANCYIKDLMRLVKLYRTYYPDPVDPIQTELAAMDFNFLMTDMPKLLNSMKVGANRLRQIVLSLQNFLRAEQAEMKPIDIHEGINNTLLLLQHRLKASSERPEIIVHKDFGILPLVEGFAGQLNQALMNIITNAIDVLDMPSVVADQQPKITISTGIKELTREYASSSGEKTAHAVIKIIDNGPGMTEEIARRLFDPFFTTKPVGKGTGLGLSVSYQIVVEKHGGLLSCLSEPGKGAEFCIMIPFQQWQ